jgi:hypothetical protein
MVSRGGMAAVLASLVLGGGLGAVAGGCGEDRGSVDVEGGTTGSTGTSGATTPETTESTTPETTGTTESGSGY